MAISGGLEGEGEGRGIRKGKETKGNSFWTLTPISQAQNLMEI